MGVASGMPLSTRMLELLVEELPSDSMWQVTTIGREEVWDIQRTAATLGGNLRTGLEDTFYLPDGTRASCNASLIEALTIIARDAGREIANPAEARALMRLHGASS
jgi:uncharacterized protein (DUF849 family)